jgi:tyrosinase
MFAMFQALYPDSYVEDEPTSDGTFTEKPGSTETVTSDLTPFWKDSSTFHTSESAKATVPLGYAYPETQSWNYSTQALYQKSVRAALKKLYGTTTSSSGAIPLPPLGSLTAAPGFREGNGTANGKSILRPVVSREINVEESSKSSAPISPVKADTSNNKQHEDTSLLSKINGKIKNATVKPGPLVHQDNGPVIDTFSDDTSDTSDTTTFPEYKEWIINIRAQKHCLGGPFQVHCFLGPVPADTGSWLIHANNVGTCSILGSNPATTSCEKCKADANKGLIVTGVVLFTEALRDAILQGSLQSLMPVHVEPYLVEMLHWRITQVRSCSIP